MQQFVIGKEGPQFLTEAQKKYIKHDLTDLKQISMETQLKGLQLRQSNFQFGTDTPTFKAVNFKPSTQWRSPTPKNPGDRAQLLSNRDAANSGQKSALTKVVNNESNFTIGSGQNDQNHFLSLNRQAAESVTFDNKNLKFKINEQEQN